MSEERKSAAPQNGLEPKTDDNSDIEFILNDIGGTLSKFQIYNYASYLFSLTVAGVVIMSYVFSALNLEYRCEIPECDSVQNHVYDADWLHNVIPFTNSKLEKCHRFHKIDPDGYELSTDQNVVNQFCLSDSFNRSNIVRCDQDGLIYQTDEVSIVNEFNLTCKENEWKLAMVGTYNSIARFVFMPLVGILTDRYGRRTILLLALLISSVVGQLQSFSIDYTMFVACEILLSCVACAVYPGAFVLNIEATRGKHRIHVLALITLFYNVGVAFSGALASYARHFRVYLRLAYLPGFIALILVYFSSESLRWLMVEGKQKEIEKTLKAAAKFNGRELSPKTMEIVKDKCDRVRSANQRRIEKAKGSSDENSLRALFASRTLVIRFTISSFCWIAGTFVTYGVSIVSVSLHSDKYISFIIVAMGGVLSSVLVFFILKYMGRAKCISFCLLMTGVSITGAKMLPNNYRFLEILLFLMGKCFSMVAFTCVYIHTSEMWPTPLRNSIMGLSSTLGRIGTILAPLTPLLANISEVLPSLSFGAISIVAGVLVLLLPETFNQELPDTIEEAKNIGRTDKNRDIEMNMKTG